MTTSEVLLRARGMIEREEDWTGDTWRAFHRRSVGAAVQDAAAAALESRDSIRREAARYLNAVAEMFGAWDGYARAERALGHRATLKLLDAAISAALTDEAMGWA